jgi:hypothetical protein
MRNNKKRQIINIKGEASKTIRQINEIKKLAVITIVIQV